MIPYITRPLNVFTGCSHCSPGCDNCYAERLASTRLKHHPVYKDLTTDGVWNGKIHFDRDLLRSIYNWGKTRVVMNTMGDPFHPAVQPLDLAEFFAEIATHPVVQYLLFTKRYRKAINSLNSHAFRHLLFEQARKLDIHPNMRGIWPPKNIWLVFTITCEAEQKQYLDEIGKLIETWPNIALNFEPLLEPFHLWRDTLENVKWIIMGAESGPRRRYCDNSRFGLLINQIKGVHDFKDIPIFVKQVQDKNRRIIYNPDEFPDALKPYRQLPPQIAEILGERRLQSHKMYAKDYLNTPVINDALQPEKRS